MSLSFNDTTTYKGIVQIFERECGFNRGDISGDTNKLKELAADVNLAFDDFLAIAIAASGRWQYDDSNHERYPEITCNLVDGQRDYTFTVDQENNLILDIHKVMVKDEQGTFNEIKPVDQFRDRGMHSFFDGLLAEGVPDRYDKMANGIQLDPIPSYNSTNGLKIFISREPSYFAYTDTTKKPGAPGTLHKYFALRPAQDYARRNNLAIVERLEIEVLRMETAIKEHFGGRERDVRKRLRMRPINSQ